MFPILSLRGVVWHLQILSSDAVNTGVGVYWMFYSGGSFEEATAPAGLPELTEGDPVEGLRCTASASRKHTARLQHHRTQPTRNRGFEGQ